MGFFAKIHFFDDTNKQKPHFFDDTIVEILHFFDDTTEETIHFFDDRAVRIMNVLDMVILWNGELPLAEQAMFKV